MKYSYFSRKQMDRSEMLVVLTVLQLLDQSKSIREIEWAYEQAVKKLDRHNQRPDGPQEAS
jgi:hypothetical protein